MKHDHEQHHRRSIRLQDYDYTQPGAYFVTICTFNRECLFSEIVGEEMRLNKADQMIDRWWSELRNKFPFLDTDAHIVMPNHLHGIVVLVGADLRVCPDSHSLSMGAHAGAPLPQIVQWFKTMTTNEYIRNVKKHDWPPLLGRLWQRNYYEHVIRNETTLNTIRTYIEANPAGWTHDRDNPDHIY